MSGLPERNTNNGARHAAERNRLMLELLEAVVIVKSAPLEWRLEAARSLSRHERPEFQMEGLFQLADAMWECGGNPSTINGHLEEARRLAIQSEDYEFAAEVESLRGTVLEVGLERPAEAGRAFELAAEYREEAGVHPDRRFEHPDPAHD